MAWSDTFYSHFTEVVCDSPLNKEEVVGTLPRKISDFTSKLKNFILLRASLASYFVN